jgi:hypothetical protein
MHQWLAGESDRMSKQRGVRSLCMGPRDFGKSVQALFGVPVYMASWRIT